MRSLRTYPAPHQTRAGRGTIRRHYLAHQLSLAGVCIADGDMGLRKRINKRPSTLRVLRPRCCISMTISICSLRSAASCRDESVQWQDAVTRHPQGGGSNRGRPPRSRSRHLPSRRARLRYSPSLRWTPLQPATMCTSSSAAVSRKNPAGAHLHCNCILAPRRHHKFACAHRLHNSTSAACARNGICRTSDYRRGTVGIAMMGATGPRISEAQSSK